MPKQTFHDTLISSPEILESSQLADLYNEMDILSKTLEEENVKPERRLSSFRFTEFEPPLFMPEAIQRYREAMLPLSEVSIGINMSSLGTSVQAEVVCSTDDVCISFEIEENEDGDGYIIKKRGGGSEEDIPCSTRDVMEMITELALSPEHRGMLRAKMPTYKNESLVDLKDQAIALLLITGLGQHAQQSSQSAYYTFEPTSNDLPSVTFVASKSGLDKLFRADISATGEDGPLMMHYDAGIEIQKSSSLDSLEVVYPSKVEPELHIHDTESGETTMGLDAPKTAHIEYALEIIKRINRKVDKSPVIDPMKIGSIIHLANQRPDLA